MSRMEQAQLDAELARVLKDFGCAQESVSRGERSLRDLGVATAEFAQRRREIAQRQRGLDERLAAESQAYPAHWHDERRRLFEDAICVSDKHAADAATLSSGRVPSDLPLPRDLMKQARQYIAEGEDLARRARKLLEGVRTPARSA